MKTLTEICEAIQKLGTREDLKVIFNAYQGRDRELRAENDTIAKQKFSLQQAVTFKHKGRVITGKIIKKNEMTAKVSVLPSDGLGYAQLYHVSYSLLSLV